MDPLFIILFEFALFGAGVFVGRWTRSNSSTGKAVEKNANIIIEGVKDAVKEVKDEVKKL